MSYTALSGGWCNVFVLNAHAPTEGISDNSKDNFYEELEQVFIHFPRYHIKIFYEILMQNCGESVFSNQQFGMTVYVRIVMIMVLEK